MPSFAQKLVVQCYTATVQFAKERHPVFVPKTLRVDVSFPHVYQMRVGDPFELREREESCLGLSSVARERCILGKEFLLHSVK